MQKHLVIFREMTITHDDFFRVLPKALKNWNYKVLKSEITVSLGTGKLHITLSPQTCKRIGSLTLPVIQVKFVFHDCPDIARNNFFNDFDLAFQKGGG